MTRRRLFQIACLLVFICWDIYLYETHFQRLMGGATVRTVQLQRGAFDIYEYKAAANSARCIIIFGSGDGGWGGWEDAVGSRLRDEGYTVIGIDSAAYAKTDYDLPTLQSDFGKIARTFLTEDGNPATRLIVGGWSMGAAQAIAVGGGAVPPPHLTGVLVISPLSRGRYGLRLADRLNVLPTGPGTFAAADFAHAMDSLRVAQWHAEKDTIDSRNWLAKLKDAHREYDLPQAGHDYDEACPRFLDQLAESVHWILEDDPQKEPGK